MGLIHNSKIRRYLPAYFNTDPMLQAAARLRHAQYSPSQWRVRDFVLTLDGRDYALETLSLAGLWDALEANGYEVLWFDTDLIRFGAIILDDGAGQGEVDNGLTLYARSNLLYAIMQPTEWQLTQFERAIPEAVAMESMRTAAGFWLDRHGALYGIERPSVIDDAAYLRYIFEEILRPRNTPRGMEYTLRRRTGRDVRIVEPWQHVARWDQTTLGADQRFHDGMRWTWNLLQAASPEPGAWEEVQAIVDTDRPAGCVLLPPQWMPYARMTPLPIHSPARLSLTKTHGSLAHYLWHPIWDESRLDDYEVLRNYRMGRSRIVGLGVCVSTREVWSAPSWSGHWDARAWSVIACGSVIVCGLDSTTTLNRARRFCRADAVHGFSRWGDENTRFPGATQALFDLPARRWDIDARASADVVTRTVLNLCQRTIKHWAGTPHHLGLVNPPAISLTLILTRYQNTELAAYPPLLRWYGLWGGQSWSALSTENHAQYPWDAAHWDQRSWYHWPESRLTAYRIMA